MVAGIEAAGLALALFPIVSELIHVYSSTISGRESRQLSESLKNQERIFLNSVESLLRSIISADELRKLLEDKSGGLWSDANLNQKITDHLGSEADGLFDLARQIHHTLHSLQKKLPVVRNGEPTDKTRLDRVKVVIKAFVRGQKQKASLEALTSHIKDFRVLTDDALKLAPTRHKPIRRIRNLDLIQDGATVLYNAFRDGLQCECEDLHPAHMRLEVWSPKEKQDNVCLKFSFLFADNAETAQEDHWRIAEIESQESSKSSMTSGHTGSENPPTRVTFQLDTPLVTSPIDTTSDHGLPSNHDDITNLCRELMGRLSIESPRSRQRLGSVSSSDGGEYGLFTTVDRTNCRTARSSMTLVEMLSSHTSLSTPSSPEGSVNSMTSRNLRLSPKQRVKLSLELAWAVLQLSQTSWLEGHWTKNNILLVMDPSNNPQPYVSHHFKSSRRESISSTSTMIPKMDHDCESWVRNPSLFALAIFLLEMCYHEPIEKLAKEKEKSVYPYLTAMRLAKDVESQMGVRYAQAVNACLHGNLELDNRKAEQVAQGVLKDIIEPLESVAGSFGHAVPMVTVA